MPAQPGQEESGSGSDSEVEDEEQVQRGGKKRPRGGGRAMTSKRQKQDSDAAVTLFEVVKQGKMAMTAIVDDWIEAYKMDRNEALLDLIQFFINASGCKGTVTAEMLREASEGFQDIIKRMTEEFDEDSGDYPLITSGVNLKKFRSNFSDFVQALVRQCQYQIIYDQFMMDNILTLLTELSNSQVRAFRHTSTLAAMKLMTALVNVALQLSVSLDNTQRQYEAERNKAASKRASEKLDMLLEKRKDLEDQQTEIESMLNGIFKGIFVHRYRDFIADIRAQCMEEIGVWMKMFPKVFLTDSYLKYVGWTLHDKQKEVRMKCLQTLQGLYRDDEMTKDLKLFTSRFKDRIVSMTLDKEYDVSVLAIKLLILILDHCGYDTPVLSSNDCESVYQLVYSVHRPVAVAAAEFLNKQLFASKDVAPGYTKRGRRRSANAPLITDLVLFFIESELHEHATYLVDSLWDAASSMLKDWDCMTDLLLEEPANDRDQLDMRQESALVDIMVCSVKQSAEGIPPTGRQGYSKKLAVRDKRTVIEDRVRLTEHFIVTLPSLLNKYQVDKDKATMLLQIPRFFDLELYTTSRLEKHLETLLRQIAVILEKHTEPDLLEQASMTYHYLCDNDFTMCSKAQIERQTVVDSWAENFTLALDIFKDATADSTNGADDEEIYNVVQALKRLSHLYMHNNIASCRLHPAVSSILEMHKQRADCIPEDMLEQVIKFFHCDLMFTFAIVKEREDEGQSGMQEQKEEISKLRKRVTDFMQTCEELLSASPHPKVKEASYMAICDLVILFSPQLAHSCPNLRPLVQRPSDTLQHLLVDFVNSYVFVVPDDDDDDKEDTVKIDALHHRRLLLAAICKLFIFNMIEIQLAASVFQQYIRFYSDYGDIIKETISKSRHANKMACAHTLGLSLMTLYRETVRMQGGSLDHSSQEYGHMKELARRLALTFGLDQVKTRDAVAALHKEGIIFGLKRSDEYQMDMVPPENLSFLSILVEFSSKLMRQDRKTVVQYLDRHIKPHMLKQQTAGWIPLVTYRNSLLQGSEEADTAKPQHKSRGRGRKKRHTESEMEGPRTPMTPATPMSPAPGGPMTPMNPVPQHTSTVQRDPIPAKQMRMDGPNVSTISYQQQQEGKGLSSWLATGRDRRKRARQRQVTKDSIAEAEEDDQTSASVSAEVFQFEKKEAKKVKEISRKMERIHVRSNRKKPEKMGAITHQEDAEESNIERFSEEEGVMRETRSGARKKGPLPHLDEEIVCGFARDSPVNEAERKTRKKKESEDEEPAEQESGRVAKNTKRRERNGGHETEPQVGNRGENIKKKRSKQTVDEKERKSDEIEVFGLKIDNLGCNEQERAMSVSSRGRRHAAVVSYDERMEEDAFDLEESGNESSSNVDSDISLKKQKKGGVTEKPNRIGDFSGKDGKTAKKFAGSRKKNARFEEEHGDDEMVTEESNGLADFGIEEGKPAMISTETRKNPRFEDDEIDDSLENLDSKKPGRRMSGRGKKRSARLHPEDSSDVENDDGEDKSGDPPFLHSVFSKIAQDSQNVTIDDVTIDDEIFNLWDNKEKNKPCTVSDNASKQNMTATSKKGGRGRCRDDGSTEMRRKTRQADKTAVKGRKTTKSKKSSALDSEDDDSDASFLRSQLSVTEKSEIEKPEKSNDILSSASQKPEKAKDILSSASCKNNNRDDILGSKESRLKEYEDVLSDQDERGTGVMWSAAGSETQENLAPSTNPFSKIMRDASRKGAGDAPLPCSALERDETTGLSDFMSEESDSESNDGFSPLTQKSAATTARTHISDLDLPDLLEQDVDIASHNAESLFGVFANVVRDVRQNSQTLSSMNSTSQRSAPGEVDYISDDVDTDDDVDFADILQTSTLRTLTSPASPLSSDGDDDNFASMFGFTKKAKHRRLRQHNLLGSNLASPAHGMATPVPQGYHQHSGYQMQSPQIPGTSQQQQQQFLVPGQSMMYQQHGYQMQMQSPGQMQGGQPPYYGS